MNYKTEQLLFLGNLKSDDMIGFDQFPWQWMENNWEVIRIEVFYEGPSKKNPKWSTLENQVDPESLHKQDWT